LTKRIRLLLTAAEFAAKKRSDFGWKKMDISRVSGGYFAELWGFTVDV
jgi:hypothetical protein